MYVLFATLVLALTTPLPNSASIVDVPAERRDSGWHIGNVKVVFSDGHSEMWTKLGRSLMPKVSKSGLVGWVYFESRNEQGWEVDNMLRICGADGRHKDFAGGPFIEDWGFADDDKSVVIKSRYAHGSATYIEYDMQTAKIIDSAHGLIGSALPLWARPYSD